MIVAMMGMIALGMILMTGILTLEILIVENYTGRMTWPYGDKVPGNYLSKAALPAFCVLVAIAVSNRKPFNGIAALISFITIIMSVVTGERINFLLRACSGMLAGIAWKPKFSRMAALILLEVSAIFAVFLVAPNIGYRFIDKFIYQLPTHQESPYYKVMNGGLESFEQAPVFGIGTGNYRILCPDIMEEKAHGACHPHPHNYYIQILAETGIVGFLFGCLMIGSILWRAAKISLKGREKVIASIAFIVPLAFFFPLQSTADFFGQWNNIFMWSSIGFVLASGNLLES